MRESEGDPHLKARVRSLQKKAARKTHDGRRAQADVVVTNPAHYAVRSLTNPPEGAAHPRQGAM